MYILIPLLATIGVIVWGYKYLPVRMRMSLAGYSLDPPGKAPAVSRVFKNHWTDETFKGYRKITERDKRKNPLIRDFSYDEE